MKITTSKGTPDQFIAELNNRIDYLEGNITSSKSIKSSRYNSTEIDTIETNVLDIVGSRSNIKPAIIVDLGDGTSIVIVDDDNAGVWAQNLSTGEVLYGSIDIENKIYESWDTPIESATNTCGLPVKVDTTDIIEQCNSSGNVIESAETDNDYYDMLIPAINTAIQNEGYVGYAEHENDVVRVTFGEDEEFVYNQPTEEIVPNIEDVTTDSEEIAHSAIIAYGQYTSRM